MRAILLAAGFGTRLRPLTDTIPKCLVPIAGKPLLQIWLERLSDAAVNSFLINTHYLYKKVDEFVEHSPLKSKIKMVYEPELLGTAGTLHTNLDFFDGEDGMLIHADNFCMADIPAFIKAHLNRPPQCLLTMMAFHTDAPSKCGIIEVDDNNVAIGFHEKVPSPPGNMANGAVYILSAELLKQLPQLYAYATDFSLDVLPYLLGKIFVYETNEFFLDIGTLLNYNKANSHATSIFR
jgi:mannose-1-phosphate guanylyltransferase